MAVTDFAIHTRTECSKCKNSKCFCVNCKGVHKWCGMDSDAYPLMGGCKWNSILVCPKYKE